MTINENQKKFHRSTTLNLRIPTTKSEDESATFVYVCRSCNAVLEMFKKRSQAIVFKSFLTTKKMKKLQTKLLTNWKEKNIFFILKLYKGATEFSNNVLAQFDAQERRFVKKQLQLRQRSKESIMNPERTTQSQLNRINCTLAFRK